MTSLCHITKFTNLFWHVVVNQRFLIFPYHFYSNKPCWLTTLTYRANSLMMKLVIHSFYFGLNFRKKFCYATEYRRHLVLIFPDTHGPKAGSITGDICLLLFPVSWLYWRRERLHSGLDCFIHVLRQNIWKVKNSIHSGTWAQFKTPPSPVWRLINIYL